MRDITARKVDGIIAWHPDRLARNMVEAGQIIHKLDTGIIKDMRFKTFHFTNDANGKMMLGMLFVFAKHYSDDLKTKVDRGIKNNLAEGKSSGSPKHGYIRDDGGLYRPDPRNFELIQEAWQRRADGATLQEVADFLNERGYAKYSKKYKDYVPQKVLKATVGQTLADSFYFGMLNQKSQTINLMTLYNFIPITDEATFYKIQGIAGSLTRRTGKKRIIYYPLRHRLFCSLCGEKRPMNVGRSKSRTGKYYLYYWCANKKCIREPLKTVRANIILDQITTIIEEHLGTLPDEAYHYYLDEVKGLSAGQKTKLRSQLTAAKTILKGHENKQAELSLALGRAKNTKVADHINNQMGAIMLDIERQEALIKSGEEKLAKSELPALTPDEFAERVRKIPIKFKKANVVQKDIILRNLFLNLHIGHKEITSYLWQEPFATLLKASNLQNGRDDKT